MEHSQTVPDQVFSARGRGSRTRQPYTASPWRTPINTRSYKEAGVDIDAGAALVESIKPAAASTRRRGSMSDLGGFAALFDMGAAGFRDPLLVATTDGVGTKLKIAIATGCHDSIGIDLVAMCVNDIVVQGAEPLFFLDYFATGRLDVATGAAIIGGIAAGCREAGCALIGGETAEMPGMYGGADYDLAGFAVGAVERDQVLPRAGIVPGDVVLGLDSSGLHSNGFSLVRRIVAEGGFDYAGAAPFAPRQRLGQALLVPTRIYIRSCLAAARSGAVKALAHVTGGGLIENLPRVLPTDIGAELDASKWPLPPVFSWLMRTGDISRNEMARAFNCGIGMMAIVAAADAETVTRRLADAGERVRPIGRTVVRRADQPAVTIAGMEQAWPA